MSQDSLDPKPFLCPAAKNPNFGTKESLCLTPFTLIIPSLILANLQLGFPL
jgi:hypothetical protein